MSTSELIILIATGLAAGTLSGLFGIGGGIIVVPALVFFLGLTQHQAQGTSLFFMVFPVGLMGAMNYYKHGYVNMKFAIVLVIAFFIGSFLGSELSVNVPEKLLRKLFGLLFFVVGAKMIFGK
jgi:uncharacterized protein